MQTPSDICELSDALREIERLQEQIRNRDYALERLGEKRDAEIERLRAERNLLREMHQSAEKECKELLAALCSALQGHKGWDDIARAAIAKAEGGK